MHQLMKTLLAVIPTSLVLTACGGTPSCDDKVAMGILKGKGYDVTRSITISVNEAAKNASCQGVVTSSNDIRYNVFRASDGGISVTSPGIS